MSTAQPYGKSEVKISPVCNKCRERHVKCDGGPQCSRCLQEGSVCEFRPSRRGKRPSGQQNSASNLGGGQLDVFLPAQTLIRSPRPRLTPNNNSAALPFLHHVLQSQPEYLGQLSIPVDISTYLTDLFYANFCPEHPFVLPREHFVKELAAVEQCSLKPVIEYIGTFYDATFDRVRYQNRAGKLLSTQRYPSDGSLVQALLIFAIGLRTDGYFTKANIILRKATNCALMIGMNDHGFSCLGPGGEIIQVESWRRTWSALESICRSWRSSSNLDTTTPDMSRCPIVESTASLDARVHYDHSSLSTTSMIGKKSGASPCTAARTFRPESNTSNGNDDSHRQDDDTWALDELLAESGLSDCIATQNAPEHSTEWWNHPGSRSPLFEMDFTQILM